MTQKYHELLLTELRMATYRPGDPADMKDRLLCKAVTANENLKSLGYVLRPADLMLLAVSPSLDDFYKEFKKLVPDVKAKPMYPGFPRQVLKMDEAQFRLHQMMHYFSTYNVEMLTGKEVHQGWLPEYDEPERTEKDTTLLKTRVIDLIPENEGPAIVLRTLLGRRERLTNPELELVAECAACCTSEQLKGMKVRFKENLELLFPLLMNLPDRHAAIRALHAVCSHTGDVFRCMNSYLHGKRWHLATAEKRLAVKLLESYSVDDLRRNMMQSRNRREHSLLVLQHLDYNRFSRNKAHLEAVRALRNGELLSWNGIGEALLQQKDSSALTHFAQRPGYMLRILNRLLSLGYIREDIEAVLLPAAGGISGHLVLKTIRTLMKRSAEMEEHYAQAVAACHRKYQQEQRAIVPTYETAFRRLEQEIEMKRAAVNWKWWNQPRIDAERQAYGPANEKKEIIASKKEQIAWYKGILKQIDDRKKGPGNENFWRNADLRDDLYVLFYQKNPDTLQEMVQRIEDECRELQGQLEKLNDQGAQVFRELMAPVGLRYISEVETVNNWEKSRRETLEEDFAAEIARYQEAMRTLSARRNAELHMLEKRHQAELRISRFDELTIEILKKTLEVHFLQAQTPVKEKRIYLDLGQFDLDNSILETEDRSKDGGYIRSGISYRIPEGARTVRFFVYWNDPHRVDVDLHAGFLDADGCRKHVGWNADFKNTGVVHSGDITHSNAAEYIDIDLSAPIREIYANVNLYYGKSFRGIKTCYVGLMAVDSMRQNIKHYDPANCFFTHALTQNTNNLFYGYIDVQNRFVRFVGKPNLAGWDNRPPVERTADRFSLWDYLDCVFSAQKAQIVDKPEEADIIVSMGKSEAENSISLVDNNFFLEC